MKFTSEDLMKAMGLQVGDRIRVGNDILTVQMEKDVPVLKPKYKSIECISLENINYLSLGFLVERDYEILQRPKRVGNLKCRDVCEDCNKCPLRIICSDYFDELNNFYQVLEQYKVSAGDLFDQEIYDLLKARLDKEVVE